jgi:protein TonB
MIMKLYCLGFAIGTILMLGSTDAPAYAQEKSAPTLAAWSNRVFDDLGKVTKYPAGIGNLPTPEGVVAVKFNCSESGAPENVTLVEKSGNRDLDNATLRAVRRIATLHPLPAGMKHQQAIIIRVLYANSEQDTRRRLVKLQADAARSNAWFGRSSSATAALEVVPAGG